MQANNAKLNNCARVYVATFDSEVVVGEVEPDIRNQWIQRSTDWTTKRQRYCVWRLLDYALRDCYGKGVDSFTFTVECGKWKCDGVRFSLSHCNNLVAVAVSDSEVGLDVEAVASFAERAHKDGFLARILTDNEQRLVKSTPVDHREQVLAQIWTKKESYYKLRGGISFAPKRIDTAQFAPYCEIVTVNGEEYALAVATNVTQDNLTVTLQQVKLKW